jgi:hypothetical protein
MLISFAVVLQNDTAAAALKTLEQSLFELMENPSVLLAKEHLDAMVMIVHVAGFLTTLLPVRPKTSGGTKLPLLMMQHLYYKTIIVLLTSSLKLSKKARQASYHQDGRPENSYRYLRISSSNRSST